MGFPKEVYSIASSSKAFEWRPLLFFLPTTRGFSGLVLNWARTLFRFTALFNKVANSKVANSHFVILRFIWQVMYVQQKKRIPDDFSWRQSYIATEPSGKTLVSCTLQALQFKILRLYLIPCNLALGLIASQTYRLSAWSAQSALSALSA